jgi:TRAP-type C4-dicarboxylate transport system substrate-binding protein
VSTLADLTGEKLRSNRNPVGRAVIRTMSGVEPFICETEDAREHVAKGDCNGNDTVYSRIYPLSQNDVIQSVVDSKHSLFLTTMIIGDRFWESLSPEVKAVIKQAAINAGRSERAETIRDGEEAKQKLIAEGKLVNDLSEQETAWFKEQTRVVYDQFQDYFEPGLIDGIIRS